MSDIGLLLTIGGSALLYLVIKNRLAALIQPLRIELAFVGEGLLKRRGNSAKDNNLIQFILTNAFNPWVAWTFAFAITPAVIKVAIQRITDRSNNDVPENPDFDEWRFYRLGLASILSTSPIAALLFIVQFAALLMLYLPVGRAAKLIATYGDIAAERANLESHQH